MQNQHIHPIFDRLLQRSDREQRLQQRSKVLWLTGLSGAGKSTIAQQLERSLHNAGFVAQVLDGDNVRTGLCHNLGFSLDDRTENIRRVAEVAKLYAQTGIITIVSFISPTIALRELAKQIIGEADFYEIYIHAPIEVCEQRDVKGLYAKARRGEIKNFTGIDDIYEAPTSPQLEIRTDLQSLDASVHTILDAIRPLIQL